MKNIRKKYSAEFKIYAVTISIQYKSILRVANELRISRRSLPHWKKLFNDGKLTLQKTYVSDTSTKELLKLQREIKDIKLERDI